MIGKKQNRNRALILFVSNESSVNRKGFRTCKTYKLFNSHLSNVVDKAKNEIRFDTILCSDYESLLHADIFIQQTGNNFDQKFNYAISNSFKLGYDEIVIIGNDSPDLSSLHLIDAFQNLSDEQNVVGPSEDGGIYLLGLTKTAFDKKITARWNSSFVLGDILKHFTLQNIFLLDGLRDIDSNKDLIEWYKSGTINSKLFSEILESKIKTNQKIINSHPLLFTEQNIFRIHTQKAPPLYFSFS